MDSLQAATHIPALQDPTPQLQRSSRPPARLLRQVCQAAPPPRAVGRDRRRLAAAGEGWDAVCQQAAPLPQLGLRALCSSSCCDGRSARATQRGQQRGKHAPHARRTAACGAAGLCRCRGGAVALLCLPAPRARGGQRRGGQRKRFRAAAAHVLKRRRAARRQRRASRHCRCAGCASCAIHLPDCFGGRDGPRCWHQLLSKAAVTAEVSRGGLHARAPRHRMAGGSSCSRGRGSLGPSWARWLRCCCCCRLRGLRRCRLRLVTRRCRKGRRSIKGPPRQRMLLRCLPGKR